MKVSAYVMAADPAWIEASVCSYYDLVERIVVSYDASGRSWAGGSVPTDEALARLRALDRDRKMVFSPGQYSRPGEPALESDTLQRQAALDEASDGFDWVIQLDTDEMLADPAVFVDCLRDADRAGAVGLHFPARNLYQHAGGERYLEICGRFWQSQAAYPGPVAIRAGSQLTLCRQGPTDLYRVDFRARNTDPWHPRDAHVHRVIPADSAIVHFSWVRSDAHMEGKAQWSGHSAERNWAAELRKWRWARRHPFLATLGTPFKQRLGVRLRIARVQLPAQWRDPCIVEKEGSMSTAVVKTPDPPS